MRIFIFFLACMPYYIAAQPAAANRNLIDVTSYNFGITVYETHDSLIGNATVNFLAKETIEAFELDLVNPKKGSGMYVYHVTGKNGVPLKFSHENNILSIQLPGTLPAQQNYSVLISYSGIPADGLIISKNKYGKKTFFSDNWPNRAKNWIPCIDHPSDKAAVKFEVTTPLKYKLVANGIKTEETIFNNGTKLTVYKEAIPLSTKIMAIGIAEFSEQYIGEAANVPVTAWVFTEDRSMAQKSYGLAIEVLNWFDNKIAPYPFNKLANVQSKTIFGGMENASAIFYAEGSVQAANNNERLLAHEIAHQWFGNMATEAAWPHLWLSEGFATYFAHLYMYEKYGADTLKAELEKDRKQIIQLYKQNPMPVVNKNVKDYMQLLNANSYQKGSWILHMLHKKTGDSIFMKGVKEYYNKFKTGNAVTEDFKHIMEETSGKPLNTFFNQWLYSPVIPELNIQWEYDKNLLKVTVTQVQKELFEIDFVVRIHTTSGILDKSIALKNKEHQFSLPLTEAPLQLQADPNTELLALFTLEEKR